MPRTLPPFVRCAFALFLAAVLLFSGGRLPAADAILEEGQPLLVPALSRSMYPTVSRSAICGTVNVVPKRAPEQPLTQITAGYAANAALPPRPSPRPGSVGINSPFGGPYFQLRTIRNKDNLSGASGFWCRGRTEEPE